MPLAVEAEIARRRGDQWIECRCVAGCEGGAYMERGEARCPDCGAPTLPLGEATEWIDMWVDDPDAEEFPEPPGWREWAVLAWACRSLERMTGERGWADGYNTDAWMARIGGGPLAAGRRSWP